MGSERDGIKRNLKKDSFTLIELLVVIAIISILTAILLPALNSARGMAKSISCMSNMKTMGCGLSLYISDNQIYLPATASNSSNFGGWWNPIWPVSIRDYIGRPGDTNPSITTRDEVLPLQNAPSGALLCPSTNLSAPGAGMRISYLFTVCSSSLADTADPRFQGGAQFWNASTHDGRLTAKSMIKIPTNSVVMIEKYPYDSLGIPYDYPFPVYTNPILYPNYAPDFAHNNRASFLFMDMHVSSYKMLSLFDSNWIPK